MTLGELIAALQAADPRTIVPHGFGEPHSWRGDYYDLAFDPAQNVTVGSMLAHARSAVDSTYRGWKGGDYTMGMDSDCHLAARRDIGETLGPTLLRLMLAAGTIPDGPETITVYASIGNSDDKLPQARWSEFVRAFVATMGMHAPVIHGEWFSSPTSPFQNACVCFEGDAATLAEIKEVLGRLARAFGQDSIAWAVASTEFIAAAGEADRG